jgi:hypothetical protein
MRTFRHLVVACCLATSLASCGGGGGGSSNGGGTGPTPTPQSLTITPGTASLRVSQTETFTGTLTLSNGTSQAVQPTWQSDNVTVLTFESNVARGRANGTATIIGTAQGLTATRLIRVYPNYQGGWAGDYVVRRCTESGAFVGSEFCDRENGFQAGDVLPVDFDLQQQDQAVNGTMALGQIEGTFSGSIDGNGRLNGTGSLTFTSDDGSLAFALDPISVDAQGDRLTGRFTVTVTSPGFVGQGMLETELNTVVRISSGSGTSSRGPTVTSGTLRDFARALRR